MKKRYLTILILITYFTLFGQKELIIETGDIISKSEQLNGDNSYQLIAGSYAEFLDNFGYLPSPGNYLLAKTEPLVIYPPEIGTTGGSSNNNEGGIVGTISGNFTVTPTGAAVYSVPINVPTGTSGMTPELALIYNSQFDDGILGERWTLSGLSAITLAPKMYYYDEVSEAVELPQVLGPFNLDGKRLLIVNQNSSTNTIEYRTEVDEFKKIIAHTYSLATVTYFNVYSKSGLIYEYGNTENSKHYLKDEISGNKTKIAWYVNKISDRLGNYIEFEYYQDEINGELRIKEIRYTGNYITGLLPYNKVEFIYNENRDEVIETNFKALISSSKCLTARITKYLTGINCYTVGDALYREYEIQYESDGLLGKKHIEKIYEKVSDETFYNPLVFNWELQSEDYDLTQSSLSGDFTSAQTNPALYPGDFNGNGRTDFINVWYDESLGKYKMCVNFDKPSSINEYQQGTIKTLSGTPKSITVLDFNGDGYSDIIVEFSGQEFEYYMMVKAISGNLYLQDPLDIFNDIPFQNSPFPSESHPGDYNGDGIEDILINILHYDDGWEQDLYIVWGQTGGLPSSYIEKNFTELYPYFIKVGDFDGDGKTEMLLYDHLYNESFIYSIEDDQFVENSLSYEISLFFSKTEIGDFNGDRKTDVLKFYSNNTWKIYLSCGNDFIEPISITEENVYNDNVYPCDFNGDGRTDILVTPDYENGGSWSGVKIWVANTDGKDFTEVDVSLGTNPIINTNTVIIPGNFTGNGRTDFIAREGDLSSPEYFIYRISEGLADGHRNLIKYITNGLGDQFEILYEPMTNYTIYSPEIPIPLTKNKDISYPISNFIAPIYLVGNVLQSTIGGSKNMDYYYRAAKTHRYGKGFLGFQCFEQKDLNSNIKTTQCYDYDEVFYHLYSSGSKINFSGSEASISLTINTVDFKVNANNPLVFFPYTDVFYSRIFEIEENFIKSSKTNFTYDEYGNLVSMKTFNGDVDFDNGIPPDTFYDDWYSEEVTNTYSDADEANWVLGRLIETEVTSHIPIPDPNPDPPVEDITRTSAFEYYDNTSIYYGMLKTETYEPDDPKSITKEYFYDSYGNIIKTERSALDMDDRIIETEYDTDLPESERKGRFLTQTENGLGHTESKVYDQVKGVVLEITGPNSFTTQFQYDDFGSLIKTIGHNEIESASVLRWVPTGDSDAPEGEIATFYSWAKQSGTPPVKTYFDNRGKQLRIVNIGFDGTKIFSDYDYDYHELLVSLSDPYFKGTTNPEILYTTYAYDELNRKETETLPGNRITTIDYQGLTTEVTNPKGKVTKRVLNHLGWLIKSYDASEENYVQYTYYSNGQVRSRCINDHPETEIFKYYDVFGNCTTLVDPALGTINYEYNTFGELKKKTKNGDIVAINITYDVLGRLTYKYEPLDDRRYYLNYDTEPNGIGKLASKVARTGYYMLIDEIAYTYDDYGRVEDVTEIVNVDYEEETFVTAYDYDVFSRIKQLEYPSGFSITHKYNPNGYLGKIIRDTDNKTVWELKEMNARQQMKEIKLGNGLSTTTDYYPNTGYLESIKTNKSGVDIQDLGYVWDDIGNLVSRDKNSQEGNYLLEEFSYDDLNRLIEVDNDYYTGQATTLIDYDELGRIMYKKSANSLFHIADNYTYAGDGDDNPYNLWKIDNNPAFYQNEDQEIFYTHFDKIYHIDQGNKTLDIMYGLGHSRKVQTISDPDNSFEQTKVYIGGIYEKVTENGSTKEVHYIAAGDGLCAIYTKNDGSPNQFVYVHKDHLGSVQAISDETGLLVEEYSYDAWGSRRDPNTWIPYDTPEQKQTDRGFTGHEHLDLFALVNMNGRVYDPVIGYFTSPDPYSQFPGYTQGFNRYSYCLNNPLSLTDPSGYFSCFRSNFTWNDVYNVYATTLVTVAAVYATIATAGIASPVVAGAVGGFVAGAGMTIVNGGDFNDVVAAGLKGAILGAVSGAFSSLVGTAFNTGVNSFSWSGLANEIGRALAHGVLQGALRVSQGGKFEHGFFAGAISSISGSFTSLSGISSETSVVIGAALGGTAEALGGGKFANGAITGAFVVLFNHLLHQDNNQSEGDWPTTEELERDFAESFEENVMETYVNDENYVPTDSDDLAQDLLYSSGDLLSDKHYFGLSPIEMRLEVTQNGQTISSQPYRIDPYINNGLPTVYDPGYLDPISFTRNGFTYKFVIKYQIRLPL